jgi:hypothetical protein
MKTLKEILSGGFDFAREKGLLEGRTNKAEAEFLRFSPALLSRLKNNKTSLTAARAKEIALKLSCGDEDYRQSLEMALAGKQPATAFGDSSITGARRLIESVEALFYQISNTDSLLCVDYRDFPQTVDSGQYPSLADTAARAIASGLDFGFPPHCN